MHWVSHSPCLLLRCSLQLCSACCSAGLLDPSHIQLLSKAGHILGKEAKLAEEADLHDVNAILSVLELHHRPAEQHGLGQLRQHGLVKIFLC